MQDDMKRTLNFIFLLLKIIKNKKNVFTRTEFDLVPLLYCLCNQKNKETEEAVHALSP